MRAAGPPLPEEPCTISQAIPDRPRPPRRSWRCSRPSPPARRLPLDLRPDGSPRRRPRGRKADLSPARRPPPRRPRSPVARGAGSAGRDRVRGAVRPPDPADRPADDRHRRRVARRHRPLQLLHFQSRHLHRHGPGGGIRLRRHSSGAQGGGRRRERLGEGHLPDPASERSPRRFEAPPHPICPARPESARRAHRFRAEQGGRRPDRPGHRRPGLLPVEDPRLRADDPVLRPGVLPGGNRETDVELRRRGLGRRHLPGARHRRGAEDHGGRARQPHDPADRAGKLERPVRRRDATTTRSHRPWWT